MPPFEAPGFELGVYFFFIIIAVKFEFLKYIMYLFNLYIFSKYDLNNFYDFLKVFLFSSNIFLIN